MNPLILLASAAAMLPGVALAQDAPAAQATPVPAGATATAAIAVGATVYDPQGAVAGTVDSVTPQAIVINTGTNKVGVPPSAIGTGAKGPTASLTKAQLDAAYQQQAAQAGAQARAQLVPGAQVKGAQGAVVGTVKAADAQFVTLTTARGDVKLPAQGFAAGANGIQIGMTAAQLDAAITQAGGGNPPPPANQPTDSTAVTTDTATGATTVSTVGGTTQGAVDASADAAANAGAPDAKAKKHRR